MIQRRRSGDGSNFQESATSVVHREGAPVRKSRLRRPQANAGVGSASTNTPRQTALKANVGSAGTKPLSSSATPPPLPYEPRRQSTPLLSSPLNAPHAHNSIIVNRNATARRRKKSVRGPYRKTSALTAAVAGCSLLILLWIAVVLVFLRQIGGDTKTLQQHHSNALISNFWSSLRGSTSAGSAVAGGGGGGGGDGGSSNADGDDYGLPPASEDEIIDMRALNAELKFDNPDGGVWKQGWDVAPKRIGNIRNDNDKLQVFVVPHSHCDPGWIKTFDQYFKQQVIEIITTVINALSEDERRTFIWAEISYFSWWWEKQSAEMRATVKRLLDNGQFEFVTGGWVQPDEANSELYAMEVQLQEGHDWIRDNLGNGDNDGDKYVPKYGWSIDPFGYSPTMAYLLRKYKFRAMLIQRVHYAVKKELAKRRHLEFYWRQTWDSSNAKAVASTSKRYEHDIFTHVMPFFSYDVPHTCGPDPSVCCQFDFHRFPVGDGPSCPWNKKPQPIKESNVKERALLALDQYRKKAALYRTNVVLIPLGDDFRYQKPKEALAQYTNHQKIHDWINANVPDVQIQFGTLSQYFEAVLGSNQWTTAAGQQQQSAGVPVLKGSFFTYADVNEDYWSGYFTSRAFDKALDRQLERVLYSAESLLGGDAGGDAAALSTKAKKDLRQPRRELSLFQHHDGITGTAKSHVVEDYAQRMFAAIKQTQKLLLTELIKQYPQETKAVLLRDGEHDASVELQPCLVSNAPRGLAHNLCIDDDSSSSSSSIVAYNPLDTMQTCGLVEIPPQQLKVVELPCEVPGPLSTKMKFDETTGLMLEPFREEWKVWKVREGGAYLFKPGELTSYDLLASNNHVVIENGGYVVITENWKRTIVERQIPSEFGTNNKATVIDFIYEVHVDKDNEEWFVRFSSDVHNGGVFHTDLNGFNFDTHHFRSDMPIQSQVYPMPTFACIEDDQSRMVVLSEHAQGTASLQDGSIDVWLDRRLRQDDNRGLGQSVQDNRPLRTRFRLMLEKKGEVGDTKGSGEFTITKLTRRMWTELQHPLEMFGRHVAKLSPAADPNFAEKASIRRERIRNRKQMGIRRGGANKQQQQKRLLNETEPKTTTESIFSFVGVSKAIRRAVKYALGSRKESDSRNRHTVNNTVVPFVYMVYKRVDYLKKAINSLRKSDFPKSRVPLIISHDGKVPGIVDYAESLKNEFKVVQIFHPHSCYDHPRSFPGNDTQLNVGFKGDRYGNPRSSWVTCCKHHFTWILKTVFDDLDLPVDEAVDGTSQEDDGGNENDGLDNNEIDTFLFMEEDYIVAPTIYQAIINGMNQMEANEDKTNGGGFFGLGLDPTQGNTEYLPTWIPDDQWYVTAFRSGPMTMNRKVYNQLQAKRTEYCRFDEYNWDWTLVHMQGEGHLPHTLLMPSRGLAKHIGVKDGMHNSGGEDFYGPDFEKLETKFAGTKLYNNNAKVERLMHKQGYGGWGHPADQQHCVNLLTPVLA